ncbi:TetR family transcriptional regulator [Streptomyces kanamyceticus]|uniref:TetR family transcriptional regulator n=1 Tax=Streptomyces kanamyceticus TaxID=1967 RepID=A0A5J6GJF5_STRKN|nr:TetR family transcriptional regulator [Streptomyces kanamyceticus]QEU96010.1 TetR family transcriptional regulator [Streptomyces kanamyceticus]
MDEPRTTPAATRIRLIETAERLFAERGVHAVSLREIAAAAGQRNTSAVAYHFGDKRGLVTAVYAHRLGPTNEGQLRRIAALDEQGIGKELRPLVEVFVHPMAERITRAAADPDAPPSHFLRFVAQALYVEGIAPHDLAAETWTRALHQLRPRIDACLGELPAPIRADRWRVFVGLTLHTLADHERALQSGAAAPGRRTDLLVAGLVDAAVAVLTAPVSPATGALLARQAPVAAARDPRPPDPGGTADD